jgi:hypothetical protein
LLQTFFPSPASYTIFVILYVEKENKFVRRLGENGDVVLHKAVIFLLLHARNLSLAVSWSSCKNLLGVRASDICKVERQRAAMCSTPQGQSSLQLLRPNRIWPAQISIAATGGSWGLFQIASNHNFLVSNCAGNLDNYLCNREMGHSHLSLSPCKGRFF